MRASWKTRVLLASLAGALGACDGPDISDDGPSGRARLAGVECDVPGVACTWLGFPGAEGFNGDGHHRLDTELYWSFDMVFASDGTPWFIDWNNHLVRRVLADDTVETVVGWTDPVFPGDGTSDGAEKTAEGAPGEEVQLNHPTDMAVLPGGDVLLMAWHNHKLRVIDPDTGTVRIVTGDGAGYYGDGGPAELALFKQPSAVQLDEDGNVYILDQQNQIVRRIGTDGLIDTIAGTPATAGYAGDGGPALEAQFNWEVGSNPEPHGGLAYADRKLYVSDTLNDRVRVVDLDAGTIDTVAGNGTSGYAGDGGPATEAALYHPRDLEIGPDDDLYIADTNNGAVRAVDLASGAIRTVAGTGALGLDLTEGKLATETMLRRPFGIAFDPDGNLFVMDTINSRIVRVAR